MAFNFEKGFNKFAEFGNSLNRTANKVIGKDVFGEIKPMEKPKEFPPYDSFPQYAEPEPEQWTAQKGEDRKFVLEGNEIFIPANLDACFKYRKSFEVSAKYYTEQFKFKYHNCVQDFDSLIHYFPDLYLEGLSKMAQRAFSLLLPFGVFTADLDSFTSNHMNTYNKAINSFNIMAGIEQTKNQQAKQLGNQAGNSVRMSGGGFGFKGAMKGVAKAEAFNLGMGLFGEFIEHQSKMSPEEKEKAFNAFKQDVFFQEVYSDYINTFLTFVQMLCDCGIIDGVTTKVSTEYDNMFKNVQNPMFPKDKIALVMAKLISTNPFVPACFTFLENTFGRTEEVNQIINYFLG